MEFCTKKREVQDQEDKEVSKPCLLRFRLWRHRARKKIEIRSHRRRLKVGHSGKHVTQDQGQVWKEVRRIHLG